MLAQRRMSGEAPLTSPMRSQSRRAARSPAMVVNWSAVAAKRNSSARTPRRPTSRPRRSSARRYATPAAREQPSSSTAEAPGVGEDRGVDDDGAQPRWAAARRATSARPDRSCASPVAACTAAGRDRASRQGPGPGPRPARGTPRRRQPARDRHRREVQEHVGEDVAERAGRDRALADTSQSEVTPFSRSAAIASLVTATRGGVPLADVPAAGDRALRACPPGSRARTAPAPGRRPPREVGGVVGGVQRSTRTPVATVRLSASSTGSGRSSRPALRSTPATSSRHCSRVAASNSAASARSLGDLVLGRHLGVGGRRRVSLLVGGTHRRDPLVTCVGRSVSGRRTPCPSG